MCRRDSARRERETDRQTDRQIDRETDRETDRQTERKKETIHRNGIYVPGGFVVSAGRKK